MELIALPVFTDNYVWLLHDDVDALVVDPGDAAPVIEALDQRRLRLREILVTHHHADHTAGVQALIDRYDPVVRGPARETLPHQAIAMADGDSFQALGLSFNTLEVPGHTAGHVAYFCQPVQAEPIVFCGDTLFSAGCGRLFEGTAAQMYDSLSRLAALPDSTRVCCAHEYTLANLRFAEQVEPNNEALRSYRTACVQRRESGQPTLPSSVGLERRVNPFLRCSAAAVRAAASGRGADPTDPISVLATLRQWKNEFR